MWWTTGEQSWVHVSDNVSDGLSTAPVEDEDPKPLEHCTWKVPSGIKFQTAISFVFTEFIFN